MYCWSITNNFQDMKTMALIRIRNNQYIDSACHLLKNKKLRMVHILFHKKYTLLQYLHKVHHYCKSRL